ncbi:MAG TPA: sel1 repeat family protein, partial [Anaeromyxobacter sp.]|nr:sel1 repeat family protein [Anaeromyxobacter sp.]
ATAGLAGALLHGEGIARDRPAAVRHYRRAAAAGLPAAMHELALCLRDGLGVEADGPAALRWARRAAARGHVGAAWLVGQAYWWGRCGAPRDRTRAAPFLLAAARGGDPEAMYRLALSRRDGLGLRRSAPAALAWARRAAAAGSARARALAARLRRRRAG